MRLMLLSFFSAILAIVYSAGLNEEFTWSRITYRWPKPGPSKRQTPIETRGRGRGRFRYTTGSTSDRIVFEDELNAATTQKTSHQETVPKFIDYRYGES